MFKKIILPAALLACPSIVFTTIEIFYLNASVDTSSYSKIISVVNLMLGLGLMITFLYRYKKHDTSGTASFKELFIYGTKLVLTWSLIAASSISIIIKANEKNLNAIIDKSVKFQMEQIAEKKGEISPKQKQILDQMVTIQKNPLTLFAINLVMISCIGSIYNLVASGIIKSRKTNIAASS